jgi:hypothetical protein
VQSSNLAAFAAARWTWLATQCADGSIDLNQVGFERTLTSEVRGNAMSFTYDTALAEPACIATEIWSVAPGTERRWRFTPEARVVLPVGASCGAEAREPRPGILRLSWDGNTLEETQLGSVWCRGFDAKFLYRRVTPEQLGVEQLVRRYVAHWNRRDASAVARLFSSEGLLIEPFTRTPDGAPVRHEGRANVEAWLVNAFATTPWLALQLTGIELQADNLALATWSYMDARLGEPLTGRNLFVMAGGEIFATELQLLDQPVSRGGSATRDP